MGFGLDNDNLHSPNEKYNIEKLLQGHRNHSVFPQVFRGIELMH